MGTFGVPIRQVDGTNWDIKPDKSTGGCHKIAKANFIDIVPDVPCLQRSPYCLMSAPMGQI
jgi:hypothetical protein